MIRQRTIRIKSVLSVALSIVKTIKERLMVVEKLSCFEIAAFFTHYVGEGNKAVISKQERFSTTLSHSYIVFTLGRSYIVFTVVKSESNDVSVIYEAFIFAKNVLIRHYLLHNISSSNKIQIKLAALSTVEH